MTKALKPTHIKALNVELMELFRQHKVGLITDVEFLQYCQEIQDSYAKLDMTGLYDGNGIRFTSNPFVK